MLKQCAIFFIGKARSIVFSFYRSVAADNEGKCATIALSSQG